MATPRLPPQPSSPHHRVENALLLNVIFSEPGAALATLLHTAGAIVYLGGIIAYVSWARTIRRGEHNANILALGASLAYLGIAANLLGGFLRTYQPGHPSLFDFGASSWATVMVLKHLALFAGMFFAVYLFEMVAPRLRKAWKEGVLEPTDSRGRASAAIVVVSILVASVLGAVTTVLDVGAADDDGTDGDAQGHDDMAADSFNGSSYPSSGTVSAAAPATGGFDVPELGTRIEAVLQGQGAPLLGSPFQFTLTLTSPSGEAFTNQTDPTDTDSRVLRVEVDDPEAGQWEYQVEAGSGVGTYDLIITVKGQAGNILENTVVIAATSFYEINLEMGLNETLHWDWSAAEAVHFDLHTHFDGDVQYEIEEETDAHHGNYTTQREGGHSLLWDTLGDQDVRLVYRVWGNFTVHSIVG